MLTGYASIATAVEAIKLGATHYLAKPVDVDDIMMAFERTAGDADVQISAHPLSVGRLEWEYIQRVLNENKGNVSVTARALNMHRRTLQRKLTKYPVKDLSILRTNLHCLPLVLTISLLKSIFYCTSLSSEKRGRKMGS